VGTAVCSFGSSTTVGARASVVLAAGDAGILLSRFFVSSDAVGPWVALLELVVGRVARGVGPIELLVVDVNEGFIGLVVLVTPAALLSVVEAGVVVGLRSLVIEGDLVAGVRVVDPANDTLFAVPVMPGLLFSSAELVEGCVLCNELGVVAVAAPGGGLRAVELIVGLTGGLLRLLPVEVRGPVAGVVLVLAVGEVEVAERLELTNGLFGGTPCF
jgi:hypothetical protein